MPERGGSVAHAGGEQAQRGLERRELGLVETERVLHVAVDPGGVLAQRVAPLGERDDDEALVGVVAPAGDAGALAGAVTAAGVGKKVLAI